MRLKWAPRWSAEINMPGRGAYAKRQGEMMQFYAGPGARSMVKTVTSMEFSGETLGVRERACPTYVLRRAVSKDDHVYRIYARCNKLVSNFRPC